MSMLRILVFMPLVVASAAFAAETTVTPAAPAAPPVPAQAAHGTPAKPIVVTANKDVKAPWNGEAIVCTRVAPIGSLIAVRHCTTKSINKDNRAAVDEIARRPIENTFSN